MGERLPKIFCREWGCGRCQDYKGQIHCTGCGVFLTNWVVMAQIREWNARELERREKFRLVKKPEAISV